MICNWPVYPMSCNSVFDRKARCAHATSTPDARAAASTCSAADSPLSCTSFCRSRPACSASSARPGASVAGPSCICACSTAKSARSIRPMSLASSGTFQSENRSTYSFTAAGNSAVRCGGSCAKLERPWPCSATSIASNTANILLAASNAACSRCPIRSKTLVGKQTIM